jgi:hypothetical protein
LATHRNDCIVAFEMQSISGAGAGARAEKCNQKRCLRTMTVDQI